MLLPCDIVRYPERKVIWHQSNILPMSVSTFNKRSFGEDYEPSTLQSYRNGLRRYFLQRKNGENFDIGGDESLKKKLVSKKKQLKNAEEWPGMGIHSGKALNHTKRT